MKVCLSFPKDRGGSSAGAGPGLPFIVVTANVNPTVQLKIHFTPLYCSSTLHQTKLLGLKMTYDWPARH